MHSKGLDLSTEGRDVTVLFGDGAGAVVLEAGPDEGPGHPEHPPPRRRAGAGDLWLPAPGMAYERFISPELLERGLHFPQMNGRAVYVNAVKRMGEAVIEAVAANGMQVGDVDLFLFHQANLRINEAVAERLGIPPERVFNTIDRFANTTAATIPLGLHEALKAGRLQEGMMVCVRRLRQRLHLGVDAAALVRASRRGARPTAGREAQGVGSGQVGAALDDLGQPGVVPGPLLGGLAAVGVGDEAVVVDRPAAGALGLHLLGAALEVGVALVAGVMPVKLYRCGRRPGSTPGCHGDLGGDRLSPRPASTLIPPLSP